MRKRVTANCSTVSLVLQAKAPLQLDDLEAALALHALKQYAHLKGYELSSNTTRLIEKLNQFLFPEVQ